MALLSRCSTFSRQGVPLCIDIIIIKKFNNYDNAKIDNTGGTAKPSLPSLAPALLLSRVAAVAAATVGRDTAGRAGSASRAGGSLSQFVIGRGILFPGPRERFRITRRLATFAPTRRGCHVATEAPRQSRDGAIGAASRLAGAEGVGLDAAPPPNMAWRGATPTPTHWALLLRLLCGAHIYLTEWRGQRCGDLLLAYIDPTNSPYLNLA